MTFLWQIIVNSFILLWNKLDNDNYLGEVIAGSYTAVIKNHNEFYLLTTNIPFLKEMSSLSLCIAKIGNLVPKNAFQG